MAVNLRTSRKFTEFLRYTLGMFLNLRYSLRAENRQVVTDLEPPYALLPNHVGFWDPFFVGFFCNKPVQYVVSDLQFRIPVIKFLLTLVGAIPKSKAVSDFETVRNIFRVKKNKGIIGIFPEGMRNWNGCNLKPLYTTSKLIKALKIPVIVPILKGAYLVLPRWSRNRSPGPIFIEFKQVFTMEDLRALSVDEIHERLTEALSYSEWEYQREHMHKYRGRKRAEHIELALFVCPECETIGSLRSRRHTLTCSHCGCSVEYTVYGFFEREDGEVRFDNVKDWDTWQLDFLKTYVEAAQAQDGTKPLFVDDRCVVWRGYRREPMKRFKEGTLSLFSDRIELDTIEGEKIVHSLDDLHGINVQVKEIMEYYVGDALLNFRFKDPFVSGYKWMAAVNLLKGHDPVNADFLG